MGCGSSGQAVVPVEEANGAVKENGVKVASNGNHDGDDLPTMVLPDTPFKTKPPVAFEIPLEQFGVEQASTPPAHLQRLLQPLAADITLPDIEEKLAEAEQRRQAILQQRAASAQKRAQKMIKSMHEMDTVDSDHFACLLAVVGVSHGSGYGPIISPVLLPAAVSTQNLVKASPIPVVKTILSPIVTAPLIKTVPISPWGLGSIGPVIKTVPVISPLGLGINGLGLNGIGLNGIGLNGLGINGIGLNGIGLNGLGLNGWGKLH